MLHKAHEDIVNVIHINKFVCPYNQSNRVNLFGLLSADEGLDEAASARALKHPPGT